LPFLTLIARVHRYASKTGSNADTFDTYIREVSELAEVAGLMAQLDGGSRNDIASPVTRIWNWNSHPRKWDKGRV